MKDVWYASIAQGEESHSTTYPVIMHIPPASSLSSFALPRGHVDFFVKLPFSFEFEPLPPNQLIWGAAVWAGGAWILLKTSVHGLLFSLRWVYSCPGRGSCKGRSVNQSFFSPCSACICEYLLFEIPMLYSDVIANGYEKLEYFL